MYYNLPNAHQPVQYSLPAGGANPIDRPAVSMVGLFLNGSASVCSLARSDSAELVEMSRIWRCEHSCDATQLSCVYSENV